MNEVLVGDPPAATASHLAVHVSMRTQRSRGAMVDLALRDDIIGRWLGTLSRDAGPGQPLLLQTPGAPTLTWTVNRMGWDRGVFTLTAVATSGVEERTLRLRVTPRTGGRAYLRMRVTGMSGVATQREHLAWAQGALNRLAVVDREDPAERALRRVRQAVVIVHGIGEQLPGTTLRAFTRALFPGSPTQPVYVKPDRISGLHGMPSVRIPGDVDAGRPSTDIYELYWAHLLRDNTFGQVIGWVGRRLLTPRKRIPPALRRHVLVLQVVAVLAIGTVAGVVVWKARAETLDVSQAFGVGAALLAVLGALGAIAWKSFKSAVVVGRLGDAARYFEPRPENVQSRQAIRQAGVEMLDALHESGQYQRIILFGHSLGSVIAYDILSAAWIRRSRIRSGSELTSSRAMFAVENLLNLPGPQLDEGSVVTTVEGGPDISEVQRRQYEAWLEYRRNGFDWRVTDFVTAGSPLAHARLLLDLDRDTSFDDLIEDRSLPTCPPQTEQRPTPTPGRLRAQFTFTHGFPDPKKPARSRSVQIPHSAALFAITRWTNLYFPITGLIAGDPIGGPMREAFGSWIYDVALTNPKHGPLAFAHTRYWGRTGGEDEHLTDLLTALSLTWVPMLKDLAGLESAGSGQS